MNGSSCSRGQRIQRAPLAASVSGLLVAYARCPSTGVSGPGDLVVELWRDGMPAVSAARSLSCQAYVHSIAVVGNVAMVAYGNR